MSLGLLVFFLVYSCVVASFVTHARTDGQDVSGLNVLFKSLNSPSKLKGWKSNGGDPCGDSWEGITCKGSSVTEIKLSGFELSGSLGYQLTNLKSVAYFDLSKNNLNGNLPYQLPQNLLHLDLSENDFNGNVPYSISMMKNLNYLNTAHNQLNGELSDMFQKLSELETLDLSHNQLSGKLPQSFANLTGLKSLHLQDNQLKGSINALRDLPLDDLHVENNQFTGWIPDELKDIDNLETGGNDWSDGPAPPPPPGEHHKDKRSNSRDNTGNNRIVITGVLIAGASLGALLLFAGIIIALVARKTASPSSHFIDEERGGSHHSRPPFTPESSHKLHFDPTDNYKSQKTVDSEDSINIMTSTMQRISSLTIQNYAPPPPPPHLKNLEEPKLAVDASTKPTPMTRSVECFSFGDLQTATASFAPGRLLGEGSIGRVYKAKYPNGRVLAVKEIDPSPLEEEFSTSASNISRIHHPNIAQLVGYCSDQGRYMLVYEYFRNGSLHKFLHLSDDFSKPLTWNTRIQIALGTARAIEYLHEGCTPSLVHKNIKSSNILLNADLNPQLSDYGLASFHHQTSQNLGVGYDASESTDTPAYSLKSDVYSFGVVMLELLTGRMPYDSNRGKSEESLARWATPQLHDLESLTEMVDPALCGLYPPESVSRFADIISLCIQAEPEFRPPVSEVVEALVRLVQHSNMDEKELFSYH